MESWFRSRYEDPAVRTPYESREGGYQYIWGGPYDALDELASEFGDIVPEPVIISLASDLSAESWEWARIPSEDDYDKSLYAAVEANQSPRDTLTEALINIDLLLSVRVDNELSKPLCRLLFANVISAMETYLADKFTNGVLADGARLERFVSANPDFQKQNVKYSDVLKVVTRIKRDVRSYLLDVVWHNLAKVQAMYRSTYDVDMSSQIAVVAKELPKRHDIVHRNGKTKEGFTVVIEEGDVRVLMASVSSLVNFVEQHMPEKPARSSGNVEFDATDLGELPF